MDAPLGKDVLSDLNAVWQEQAKFTIPTSWLTLTLAEGRNRQVRRMCAALGFPVLRLIRYRVGSWTMDGIACGTWRNAND